MPIKFRCEHCRQLLGISRTKAGQVADCPTCGRSVRVPELDGRRDPLPPPELDPQDSRLAGALNELAQIGLEPEDAAPVAKQPVPTPQQPEVISPEPLAEAVPIEAPPVAAPSVASSPSRPVQADEALAELAREADPALAAASRRRARSLFSLTTLGALLGAAAVGFGAGYFVGQNNRAEPVANSGGTATGAPQTVNGNGESSPAAGIKGRITYKNEDGDSRPDRKARVLVFPRERSGKRKLDVIGLRAGDAADDFRSAAAAFAALGGRVARVGDDGKFEVPLPAAGTYQILVVSNYQPRADDVAEDGRLTRLLAEYFDRPEQLLGRAAWQFDQVRYKGAEAVLWDYTF